MTTTTGRNTVTNKTLKTNVKTLIALADAVLMRLVPGRKGLGGMLRIADAANILSTMGRGDDTTTADVRIYDEMAGVAGYITAKADGDYYTESVEWTLGKIRWTV